MRTVCIRIKERNRGIKGTIRKIISSPKTFLKGETMFQESQNSEYLEMCIERVKKIDLVWVEQILDIIYNEIEFSRHLDLNDVGCNLGQFWKGLKNHRSGLQKIIKYYGYGSEKIYLDKIKEIFPEIYKNLSNIDINIDQLPECDISMCSATLEHLNYLQPGLNNILESTKQLVLLRTFLGEVPIKAIRMKEGAKTYYNIHQFSFNEIFLAFEKKGFITKVIRDEYTDSMPNYIGNGIIRTFYIIKGTKRK